MPSAPSSWTTSCPSTAPASRLSSRSSGTWATASSSAPSGPRSPSVAERHARLGVLELLDWSHLDGRQPRRRQPRGHLARLVHVLGLDEKEPAQLLLRLGEGAVGCCHLAAADP